MSASEWTREHSQSLHDLCKYGLLFSITFFPLGDAWRDMHLCARDRGHRVGLAATGHICYTMQQVPGAALIEDDGHEIARSKAARMGTGRIGDGRKEAGQGADAGAGDAGMGRDAGRDASQDGLPLSASPSSPGEVPHPDLLVSPNPTPPPTGAAAEINPSWRIFRIMSEFVDGFTFLAHIQRSVTFFGSARLSPENNYYETARELARRLAEQGYSIVTGGGPGIMEAANQGATEAGGDSIGINIQLPHEQRVNPYVKRSISLHYFFSRKVMLDYSADAYIFFPGGYGTLDEFFELVTLIQTGKMDNAVPILLIGTDFWQGLCDWMEREMLRRLHTIAPADLGIWTLTDDIDEAVRIVQRGVQTQVEQQIAEKGSAVKTPDEKLQEATRPMSGSEQ